MNHIFKKFNLDTTDVVYINPKDLKIRKKIDIFINESKNILYIHSAGKSRILQKDVEDFENIFLKIKEHLNTTFKEKYILIDSPICSKAKMKFENNNWIVNVI